MKLYRTTRGPVLEASDGLFRLPGGWDALLNHRNLAEHLLDPAIRGERIERLAGIVAPVGAQEVWAAGVTYQRSRTARMDEARDAGGGDFYDRVYDAERPELFFKAAPWRVRGPEDVVRIRADSKWTVPEPELAVALNSRGEIVGYTIGNDMSSRDIEGENPLYLPQAKIYDGACSLGPAVLVTTEPLPPTTVIELRITHDSAQVFAGRATLANMRRSPAELAAFLFRETSFPDGCILLTGTGVVPPDDFSLRPGDVIDISIDPIGTLSNKVG